MNKSGDKRGTKEVNPNNFANNPERASAAGRKRKDNSQIIKSAQQQLTTGRERRITPEVQAEIRNALFEPDKNGVPFYKQFIASFLSEAKKDPSGRAGMTLASTMFKENVLSVLDAEMEKQMNKDYEFTEYRIRKTLYPKQQEVYDDSLSRTIECICTRRAGKCWAPGTELRMFNGGIKRVEDIKVGDVLLGPDSQPRHVISLAHGFDEMYRIRSVKDEIVFECNKPHVLTLLRSHIPTKRYKVGELYDMSVEEYLNSSQRDKDSFKLIRASIEYPEQQHAIDPYVLGYWLGDGCKNAPTITIGKKELQAVDWFKRNVENLTWNECSQGRCWSIYMKGVLDDFRALGFCNKDYKDNYKYIPDSYKYDSRKNRLKLLAGLIDSDGYYSRGKRTSALEYGTSDERLRDDILELCRSLGFHTTVTTGPSAYNDKQCKTAYNITIKGKTTEVPLVLDRKRPSKDSTQCIGYSFTVEPIGRGEYYGFTLQEPDGRCLLKDYTITHNTELVARMLVREATKLPYMTPVGKALERNAIYLNRTFDNATAQMGKPVTDLLDSLGIKYEGSPGSGMIKLDNGNTITFGGYNNKGDIDKYRGFHYGLICLDEIGHLRNPDALMKETLEPALVDYGTEGKIIMTGTPPRVKANFAYIQWHNPNITHYHWSFMDNPFIPNKEAVIETACKEHGVTPDAPFIQREYYGNLEAFDIDALIFNGYKKVKEAPKDRTWSHAYIGVDWGYEDKAAVVSMVADRATKTMYVVDCWSMPKQAISTICEEICRQLNNLKTNFRLAREPWVICDSNEKGAVYELYKTYKIANSYCAYKYDRDMALDQLAEWCRTDRIFTCENAKSLIDDLDNSIWARDENTDQLLHELSDEYHPNAAMALLYASRQFAYDVMGIDATKTAKNILEGQNQ